MATRRNGLPAFTDPASDDDDDEEDIESQGSDDCDPDDPVALTPRQKTTGKPSNIGGSKGIIVQTAFDAYFAHNKSGRGQTSSNVFSELVPPLSAEEYREAIGTSGKGQQAVIQASITSQGAYREALFARFICELNEGFNILCYGFGSKRRVLNQFAVAKCSTMGHVVVVNGFQPDLGLKDVLNSIEDHIPAIRVLGLSPTSIEKQAQRINEFFSSSSDVDLYLIVHNIDAAPLRTAKAKSVLSILAHNSHIHLIASIDHINAPLLWSSSETFSRKPGEDEEEEVQANDDSDDGDDDDIIPCRGFAWLWHDLTTLESYDFELAFADRSSVSGGHAGGSGGGGARRKTDATMGAAAAIMSETAASHILASVTQKAQKLFALLGNKQLEAIEGAGGGGGEGNNNNNAQQSGLAYDVLFSAARDNFIATNDTALRTLLGEFRDHNLIVVSSQAGAGGGDVLWIPMRKERLANVLQTLASS